MCAVSKSDHSTGETFAALVGAEQFGKTFGDQFPILGLGR